MKKIMIIGASVLQMPAIKKAKDMGLEVAVVDYNPNAPGIKLADKYYNISTIDAKKILIAAKEFKPDGIATMATDLPMRTIAYVCTELNLPSISEKTALLCTDKYKMIEAFENQNVPHPWFYTINEETEIDKIACQIEYPCIIKPVDNSGSRGVTLANSFKELIEGIAYAKKDSHNGMVLIEEYLKGKEVSVEVFVIDGIANVIQITDKLTSNAPHFVELGHNEPSMLSKKAKKSIESVAKKACKAVELINGPAHIEMKVYEECAKMIEMGARLGGDCITSHLVPLSTNVDMVKLAIECSIGEKVEIGKRIKKASAIRFLQGKNGTIDKIINIDDAREIDGVREVGFFKKEGDVINELKSSSDRVGFVISQASTPKKAIKICEKAAKKIQIFVK